ncbi:MAG: hypothetical protein K2W94_02280 [Alphaproteobacteria bacterium]|nr:hypothetical protein [Alphaproteobacteria bacterium]
MKKICLSLLSFLFITVTSLSAGEIDDRVRERAQFFNTFMLVQSMMKGINWAFNPPVSQEEFESNLRPDPNPSEVIEVMIGNDESADLFDHVSELVTDVKSTNPKAKSTDVRTITQAAVRAGMKTRPNHFSPLQEGPVTSDTGVGIFSNFFQEFIQGGHLDGWISHLNGTAEAKESDCDEEDSCRDFVNAIGGFLKQIALNDSAKSPLNKYVDDAEFEEASKLRDWLKKNQGHRQYDGKHARFRELDRRIQVARDRALNEGAQYMFSLLKRMRPDLASVEDPSDLLEHEQTRWAAEEREEFETYILAEYGKLDRFEPNHLRSFWKELQGHQYGKLCYKMVCESLEERYKTSEVHQLVQQIWAVSQLDTINLHPKEARSRMPAASVDGNYGPNFGYAMEASAAYHAWMAANPLARASGDIIIDAYDSMVKFGRKVKADLFLKRFKKHLSYRRKDKDEWITRPHKYDQFMIAFDLYLLERVFHQPFVEGKGSNILEQLRRAAGTADNLLTCASKALEDLKQFSNNVAALRPSEHAAAPESGASPFVFGIGFNGRLFGSPNPSGRDEDEIWLTFSKSERNDGGYLLLSLMEQVARMSSSSLKRALPKDIKVTFERYKPLIKRHVRQKIKDAYFLSDTHWDSHMLRYIKQKRAQFEGFMSQLEQDIPFNFLDSTLQSWISETTNWYRLPPKVNIKIPDELTPEEHQVQHAARSLLFDAVAKRSFSREYPHLMPQLFLHWKNELMEKMDPDKAASVRTTEKLEDLDEALQSVVLGLLDQITTEVHPELTSVWRPEIERQFQGFIPYRIEQIGREVAKIKQKIDKYQKIIAGLKKSKSDVSLKIQEAETFSKSEEEEFLRKEVKIKEFSTITVQQLSLEEFDMFRDYFFQNRDVSQCIEPLFSKVLGHDHFFSVFVSNEPASAPLLDERGLRFQLGNKIPYDVIAPCGPRCQHHALGHLYVGDMLCHQSVDHLDHMRRTHGLEGVANLFMGLGRAS